MRKTTTYFETTFVCLQVSEKNKGGLIASISPLNKCEKLPIIPGLKLENTRTKVPSLVFNTCEFIEG